MRQTILSSFFNNTFISKKGSVLVYFINLHVEFQLDEMRSVIYMEELTAGRDRFSSALVRAILIIMALLFFFFSIDLMVTSFGSLAGVYHENILSSALNPFIGLFIGLLITAIIQSSSTTTTMVVAVVATGTLSIQEAIPIIMGANIGTTLTSTIVSLGFISNKTAFRKAVSAGVIHDFYNIILALVLFPLEYYYGFLSGIATSLNSLLVKKSPAANGIYPDSFFDFGFSEAIINWVSNSTVVVIFSFLLLFISIKVLANIIQKTIIGKSRDRLRKFVFNKPHKSFGWGMLLTAAIQSSSVATSLMVPLVATDKVRLKSAFPFIIGANLGTTVTALIAAILRSEAAVGIAICHFLFNLTGAVLFMALPFLHTGLINLTKRFSVVTTQQRIIGLLYIVFTFFLLPFLLISLGGGTGF